MRLNEEEENIERAIVEREREGGGRLLVRYATTANIAEDRSRERVPTFER